MAALAMRAREFGDAEAGWLGAEYWLSHKREGKNTSEPKTVAINAVFSHLG
jgi:hypothetical protein